MNKYNYVYQTSEKNGEFCLDILQIKYYEDISGQKCKTMSKIAEFYGSNAKIISLLIESMENEIYSKIKD